MFARRADLITLLKGFDLSIMLTAFGLASLVAYHQVGTPVSFSEFIHMRVEMNNLLIFGGLLGAWHLCFHFCFLYEPKRFTSPWSEVRDGLKATSIGTIFVMAAAWDFHIRIITPAFVATFWFASAGLMVASRLALRYLLRVIRLRGRTRRNLLIAGTNARAFAFARQIDATPELGYQIVGFVDERRDIPMDVCLARYGFASDFAGFPAFLRTHVVDEVAVSLPVKSLYAQASRIVAACEEQGIVVRILSNIFTNRLGSPQAEQFEDHSVVTVATGAMYGLATGVKRAIDICVSALLLVLLAPLAGAIILAIKLTSPGPAHFAQDRMGLNKRRFKMYKFRTMVRDAEAKQAALEQLNEMTGPVFKIRKDPRITRIGAFLRKSSLDELPQLFNVLTGEMSLVGPRAMAVRDYEGFDADWHRRRFSVRPGITGLWQVSGRSNTSFERWMALDMEYIDTWSLRMDFVILLRTIPAVVSGSGAA